MGASTVTLHALSAGHFTLPEYQFVSPASDTARKTVPSLAFLIQHQDAATGHPTRIVFDLGLRKNTKRYPTPIQNHITTRQPMTTEPDVVNSLAKGGLSPSDIDYVIYSHGDVLNSLEVHWDHVGEPSDFPTSTFIVGHGTFALLNGTTRKSRGGHSFFEHNLLPEDRSVELPDPNENAKEGPWQQPLRMKGLDTTQTWQPYKNMIKTYDLFGDGSLLIVDSPGHLPGHINLLIRTGKDQFAYLAGDAFHDRRLLTGEKDIGMWHDAEGHVCCIHTNQEAAAATIKRIRELEAQGVEVIAAHDPDWEKTNSHRFFGAT
ncbi:hypothetical protein E4T48_02549 [Aureobasidium sp. EXF-10727]|nr:hypothetical protein E4T48_02549 [Aureobasidium sp. EXF-10727]